MSTEKLDAVGSPYCGDVSSECIALGDLMNPEFDEDGHDANASVDNQAPTSPRLSAAIDAALGLTNINIRLNDEEYQDLVNSVALTGIYQSAFIRLAIKHYCSHIAARKEADEAIARIVNAGGQEVV